MADKPANTVIHVDMDAFFAAVEQLDRPELKGLPVVVGAPPDKRGVVATASYEARKYGIHSAMPSRTAGRLCPHAVFLRPRMSRYSEVSGRLMQILESFTPIYEPLSIDEAFLELSGVLHIWKHDALLLANSVKSTIRRELGITASLGIASNKFLAKLASDLHKPDGLTVVPEQRDEILAFLAPMSITRVFGVGKATAERLATFGIKTIGRIQELTSRDLEPIVGCAAAEHIWNLANGIDDRAISPDTKEKSISNEHTFDSDCNDPDTLRSLLVGLAQKVGFRLRASGKNSRTAQIKIRFGDFGTITRQTPLDPPTNTDRNLIRTAIDLLQREAISRPVRLMGFGVSNLVDPGTEQPVQEEFQFMLPDKNAFERDSRLDMAVDRIKRELGDHSIGRGGKPV